MDFLVQMEVAGHIEGGPEAEKSLREKEAVRAQELAREGILRRLWRIPEQRANWGIWSAESEQHLHAALASLPLFPYLTINVQALAQHPNDPARPAGSGSEGIPGLRGTDHFGVTVPDIEAATRFFVDVIGCEEFYSIGPISSEGDWMETHLAVHPRAVVRKLRFLRCANGINIELFEYTSPDQRTELPRNSDFGGHHLALYVDDFDKAVAYLRCKGVRVLGEPTIRREGPNAGLTWIYFLTPWGMQMELVSFPRGKGYEAHYEHRLWHPAFPDR